MVVFLNQPQRKQSCFPLSYRAFPAQTSWHNRTESFPRRQTGSRMEGKQPEHFLKTDNRKALIDASELKRQITNTCDLRQMGPVLSSVSSERTLAEPLHERTGPTVQSCFMRSAETTADSTESFSLETWKTSRRDLRNAPGLANESLRAQQQISG